MDVARLPVYADATALIGLARINRLDLLTLLRTPIYVTRRVWQEAAGDPEKPGAAALRRAREAGLLAVVEEGDADAYPELDPGESTVLAAAATAGAAVLIDERRARAFIDEHPELRSAIAQMTGIIGLVLLAKDRGYIAAVRPVLDDLLSQRFRIGPALYREILHRAGELCEEASGLRQRLAWAALHRGPLDCLVRDERSRSSGDVHRHASARVPLTGGN